MCCKPSSSASSRSKRRETRSAHCTSSINTTSGASARASAVKHCCMLRRKRFSASLGPSSTTVGSASPSSTPSSGRAVRAIAAFGPSRLSSASRHSVCSLGGSASTWRARCSSACTKAAQGVCWRNWLNLPLTIWPRYPSKLRCTSLTSAVFPMPDTPAMVTVCAGPVAAASNASSMRCTLSARPYRRPETWNRSDKSPCASIIALNACGSCRCCRMRSRSRRRTWWFW